MATKQRLALLPKRVWNMKTRHFYYQYIWFVWFWDDGTDESDAKHYRLSDDINEKPMTHHRYVRTHTNRW